MRIQLVATITAWFVSVSLSILAVENQADGRHSSSKIATVDTFSITGLAELDDETKRETEKIAEARTHGLIVCVFSNRLSGYIPLQKPNESRNVAVLKFSADGDAVLNPTGLFDYGPIPPLAMLSIVTADRLWGDQSMTRRSQKNHDPVERTYHLNGSGTGDFYIDATFSNRRLQKYRIRTNAIVIVDDKKIQPNSSWHDV